MDRFDALPSVVRIAIARADFPFHPISAERLLSKGIAPERVAAILRGADLRLSAKRRLQ